MTDYIQLALLVCSSAPVDSTHLPLVESAGVGGQLYYSTLHERLKHQQIWYLWKP